jgi:hypothetical protein
MDLQGRSNRGQETDWVKLVTVRAIESGKGPGTRLGKRDKYGRRQVCY